MSPQTSAAIAAAGATASYRGVWPAPFSSVARPPGDSSASRFKRVERWRFPRWPGIATKTGAYTILAGDRGKTIRLTGSNNRTFRLPNIAGDVEAGWDVWIANDATANLTVDGNGADTIDGSANLTVAAGAAVRLQSPDR